ncbi:MULTISPECIES: nicotinate phosphoribosyltransferase [unclassified Roseovarius]|uniref:nicotinate phosphoribosyltransferase n=1 Tax=unclassified Roseovarius TaxID=2614913 RepID=UPI00273D615A|nr:nicotinate phosphoribosyltransferase [Roseovarius sp. MMSF_3350]
MDHDEKPSRGMPRSLLYAMIPIGFVLLVGIMVLGGFWTNEATEEPNEVVEEPPAPLDQ